MRAAVERIAVRALLSTLRCPPPPPPLLLLLSMMMSSPAPCGGVLPRHKHQLSCRAHHIMVSLDRGERLAAGSKAVAAEGVRRGASGGSAMAEVMAAARAKATWWWRGRPREWRPTRSCTTPALVQMNGGMSFPTSHVNEATSHVNEACELASS